LAANAPPFQRKRKHRSPQDGSKEASHSSSLPLGVAQIVRERTDLTEAKCDARWFADLTLADFINKALQVVGRGARQGWRGGPLPSAVESSFPSRIRRPKEDSTLRDTAINQKWKW